MFERIKKYFAKRKFEKLCPHVRCDCCNNYIADYGYERCELAEQLGLE